MRFKNPEPFVALAWGIILLFFGIMLLTSCGDPHKNMHCVQSHDEVTQVPIYGNHVISNGKTTIVVPYVIMYVPSHDTVCDKWVPNT